MSDIISRQSAIEAVDKYIDKFDCIDVNFLDGLKTTKKILNDLPSAESDRKTKVEMNWATYFDTAGVVISHYPYSYKCGNCGCQLKKTYNGKDIHYCPACGYRLEWE